MKIQTTELLDLLVANKGRVIEVSFNNGFFNFTHFVGFGGRVISDTGIDSREVSWTPRKFLEFYQNRLWFIDQVV